LLRKYVSKALVIFPFEEKFFGDRGVDTTFVGHPLASVPPPTISRADYSAQYQLDPAKPWVTLMPGSRGKEVAMNLPTILESAAELPNNEYLLPVAPTLDPQTLRAQIGPVPGIHLVADSLPAQHHSRAGIIASGTATVEAALMSLPFVMVYRVTGLTYALGRARIKVPHLCMVNLIANERIVPELVQQDFTAENVVRQIQPLMQDSPARATMVAGLARVRSLLQGDATGPSAPDRAARIILSLIR
jgi:lipid-A-disaccharide synthase